MNVRRQLLITEIIAAAAPLAVALVVRLGAGPASALAVQTPEAEAPSIVPAPAKLLSPEQRRAMDWIAAQAASDAIVSPLDHPMSRPDPTPMPMPAAASSGPGPAAHDPLAGVRLTGVIGNSEGGIATIDGTLYKVGEEIAPGIRIVQIEPRLNAVTLEMPDGTRRKLEREDRPSRQTPRATPVERPGPTSATPVAPRPPGGAPR